jgi:hypothetical protein
MANYWAVDTEIDGLTDVLYRLRTMDKKIYDAMVDELKTAGSDIESDARAIISKKTPGGRALSNWGGWNSATSARSSRGVTRVTKRSELRPIPYDSGAAQSGIKTNVGRKFRKGRLLSTAVTVQQMNAGGAIWELAGSTTTEWGATGGSAKFRENLNKKAGDSIWPRSLTPAWRENKDAAINRIDDIVGKYAAEASSD